MTRLTALVVLLGLTVTSEAQEPHRFLSTEGTLTETEIASVDGGASS